MRSSLARQEIAGHHLALPDRRGLVYFCHIGKMRVVINPLKTITQTRGLFEVSTRSRIQPTRVHTPICTQITDRKSIFHSANNWKLRVPSRCRFIETERHITEK